MGNLLKWILHSQVSSSPNKKFFPWPDMSLQNLEKNNTACDTMYDKCNFVHISRVNKKVVDNVPFYFNISVLHWALFQFLNIHLVKLFNHRFVISVVKVHHHTYGSLLFFFAFHFITASFYECNFHNIIDITDKYHLHSSIKYNLNTYQLNIDVFKFVTVFTTKIHYW